MILTFKRDTSCDFAQILIFQIHLGFNSNHVHSTINEMQTGTYIKTKFCQYSEVLICQSCVVFTDGIL